MGGLSPLGGTKKQQVHRKKQKHLVSRGGKGWFGFDDLQNSLQKEESINCVNCDMMTFLVDSQWSGLSNTTINVFGQPL